MKDLEADYDWGIAENDRVLLQLSQNKDIYCLEQCQNRRIKFRRSHDCDLHSRNTYTNLCNHYYDRGSEPTHSFLVNILN